MNDLIKYSTNPTTGKKLTYNDDKHTYQLDDGRYLISSTSFVKKFFPKFDADKWAGIKAKQNGITVQEQKKIWSDNAKVATDYGTHVHEYGEALFRKITPFRTKNERYKNGRKNIKVAIEELLEEWDFYQAELIVFSEKVAGTLDFLLKHKTEPNRYLLGDWKTNKEITVKNKYKQFAFDPISHIADTNYYHYSLQLSLYKYLLLSEGFLPPESKIEMGLFHITPESYKRYEIAYYKNDIINMLNLK